MSMELFNIGSRSYKYLYQEEIRKNIRLIVYPDKNIVLKCPKDYDPEKRNLFLKRKWRWLDKQLKFFGSIPAKSQAQSYVSGSNIKYLGRNYMIYVASSQTESVSLTKGRLLIYTTYDTRDEENNKKLLDNWLQERIELIFNKRYKAICAKYTIKKPPTLNVRKMNKRWGSFLKSNKICLSPELIHVSIECIDYVITHELCHLEYHDHSKDFYTLLEKRIPGWQAIKLKLERS